MSEENRNNEDQAEKQRKLRETLLRMGQRSKQHVVQMAETPALRNTVVNPRLMSDSVNTHTPPSSPSDYSPSPEPVTYNYQNPLTAKHNTPTPGVKEKEVYEDKKKQMANIQRIMGNLRTSPAVRQQQEEMQRQQMIAARKSQQNQELLFMAVGVAGILAFHYFRSKV